MGDFRITIDATGGHGCQRNVAEGGAVGRCEQEHCPDCAARAFVAKLKRHQNVTKAVLVHWPAYGTRMHGAPPDARAFCPKDDLLHDVRLVPFPEAATAEQKSAGPPIDWDGPAT